MTFFSRKLCSSRRRCFVFEYARTQSGDLAIRDLIESEAMKYRISRAEGQ